jgi:hypothetical protein
MNVQEIRVAESHFNQFPTTCFSTARAVFVHSVLTFIARLEAPSSVAPFFASYPTADNAVLKYAGPIQ